MRIIVCVKHVPDIKNIRIDPQTKHLIRKGVPSIMNPFDQFAIQESVRIRNMLGSGIVTAISMGPPEAEKTLKHCLAFGVDDAILLTDEAFAGADTWATSYTLALAIEKIGQFDIILCGLKSTDGETGQVGPELAQHLGIPQVTYVEELNISKDGVCEVTQQMEDKIMKFEIKAPVLFTLIPSTSFRQYLPSKKGILNTKDKKIEHWGMKELGGNMSNFGKSGSLTNVVCQNDIIPRGNCKFLDGKPEDAINNLVKYLLEMDVIMKR